MELIVPPPQRTAFVRAETLEVLESVNELGVYGVYLGMFCFIKSRYREVHHSN